MVLYPFAELRHRISARPSPSKSPVPATVHTAPYNRVTGWVVLEPADRQITLEPLLRLLQRRSDLPSPLKSSLADRSEERRVGKACVSTCRSRWSPDPEKKKQ